MARWWTRKPDHGPQVDLRTQLSVLLGTRPGWTLEAQSTPGAPSEWCFGKGWETELSVGVGHDALTVFLRDQDAELTFPDLGVLTSWLDENEPLFANQESMPTESFDQLLRQRIAGWRAEGR